MTDAVLADKSEKGCPPESCAHSEIARVKSALFNAGRLRRLFCCACAAVLIRQ
jgi:hypothetical protein